jgi:hypothetical protein
MDSSDFSGLDMRGLGRADVSDAFQHIEPPAPLALFVVEVNVGLLTSFFEPDIVGG